MDILQNQTGSLLNTSIVPYHKDFLGGIQLLEDSGFTPTKQSNPLNSTLSEVFDRFVGSTGFDYSPKQLKEEFLEENPRVRSAFNLYNALERSFSTRTAGSDAPVVEFLNSKIEDSVAEDTETEQEVDSVKEGFYRNYDQLNNLLNYFKAASGTLVDLYA